MDDLNDLYMVCHENLACYTPVALMENVKIKKTNRRESDIILWPL